MHNQRLTKGHNYISGSKKWPYYLSHEQIHQLPTSLWGFNPVMTAVMGGCSESSPKAVQSAKLDWIEGQAPLPGRWDPIIRQMRTPPPGFHSSTVYHMALSSWAPLTHNERRQPVQLQAKHSTFYRPKHVSGKLTVSIQFCSQTAYHNNSPPPPPLPTHKSTLHGASFGIWRERHLTELRTTRNRKIWFSSDVLFPC